MYEDHSVEVVGRELPKLSANYLKSLVAIAQLHSFASKLLSCCQREFWKLSSVAEFELHAKETSVQAGVVQDAARASEKDTSLLRGKLRGACARKPKDDLKWNQAQTQVHPRVGICTPNHTLVEPSILQQPGCLGRSFLHS